MPDIKTRFEERLIEAGYTRTGGYASTMWSKGKAIVSLDGDNWQTDYSDEFSMSGQYQEIALEIFEWILEKFNGRMSEE